MLKFLEIADAFISLQCIWRERSKTPRGMLLLSCGGLGDTILFSHVVERFTQLTIPGESISLLLRHDGAKTSFLIPKSINIFTVDFKRLGESLIYRKKIMNDLYNANYRVVISTDYFRHPNLDEALIKACKAPTTIGMTSRTWAKYQSSLDRNSKYFNILFDSGPPIRDKILRWVDFSNFLTQNVRKPPLAEIQNYHLRTKSIKKSGEIIIHPFSAETAKQSPFSLYKRLVQKLPSEAKVVITGTVDDLRKNTEYNDLLEFHNVEFDSSQFVDIQNRVGSARLVVSVDTAMAHLSIALGTPTLCLASAAYVGEIIPYAAETTPKNAYFYFIPMSCQSCLGSCIFPLEKGMFPCVARLDPDRVIQMSLKILKSVG